MLSRHADAAFWIGRYIERAEATARMIDVHYHYGLEHPLVGATFRWSSILAISGQDDDFEERFGEPDEAKVIRYLAFDPDNISSIYSCLRLARENARSIRDQISSEMWECLNKWWLSYRNHCPKRVLAGSPHEFFQSVKDGSHLFQGITNRTLMMGEARDFHDAGRFLERADQTARILDVKYHDLLPRFDPEVSSPLVMSQSQTQGLPAHAPDPVSVGGPVDVHGWVAVLKSVGAYEAFRKTYHQGITPARVTEFLVLNAQFPASVRHSVGRVDGCLKRIAAASNSGGMSSAERAVGRLYQELVYTRATEIIDQGLHEYLENIQERCAEIGEAIFESYLRF